MWIIDNVTKPIIREVLNAVQSVTGVVGLDQVIGSWVRKHSAKEVTQLIDKLNSIKASQNDKLVKIEQAISALNNYGINFVVPPSVQRNLIERSERLKQKKDDLTKDIYNTQEYGDKLVDIYQQPGKLGDAAFGTSRKDNYEKYYMEEINNVQEKLQKEPRI